MMNGVELREPFLDNRLVELALRQPLRRKIFGGVHKYLLRKIVKRIVPESIADAPKRPVQTPQREWLRGELSGWATGYIETAIRNCPVWLEGYKVRQAWRDFLDGEGDNSYFVWQWICLGMMGVEA